MTAMVLLSAWMESQVEFWKPVAGFPGYDVSSFGRVRSYWAPGSDGRSIWREIKESPQRFLKAAPAKSGTKTGKYLQVALRRPSGQMASLKVHRLVAEAFLVNPEHLPHINHITAYAPDARLGNLEYVTPLGNSQHAMRNNLNETFKLNLSKAKELRGLWPTMSARDLAVRFNISTANVYRVLRQEAWRDGD